MRQSPINVVIIAGGTGGYSTRRSLYGREQHLNITHIVGTWDSGGGTGRLLSAGVIDLPTGDVGQGLLAASLWPAQDLEMLLHRDSDGQSMINNILAAYRAQSSSFAEAVEKTARRLSCQGKVITGTLHRTLLTATTADGQELTGEHTIDDYRGQIAQSQLCVQPKDGEINCHREAEVNPEAEEVLQDADLIILGPGSWETSIKPNGLIPGLKRAVQISPAKIAGVANLANDAHTHGWTAYDYGNSYCQLFDRQIDYLIANSGQVPAELVEAYRKGGERGSQDIVDLGQPSPRWNFQLVEHDFVSDLVHREPSNAGGVSRSLLRHSPQHLQVTILSILSRIGHNRPW